MIYNCSGEASDQRMGCSLLLWDVAIKGIMSSSGVGCPSSANAEAARAPTENTLLSISHYTQVHLRLNSIKKCFIKRIVLSVIQGSYFFGRGRISDLERSMFRRGTKLVPGSSVLVTTKLKFTETWFSGERPFGFSDLTSQHDTAK